MAQINYGSILKSLKTTGVSSGLSASSIPAIMQSIAQLHSDVSANPNVATIDAQLTQLQANMDNPAVVANITTQIESTPGVPPAASKLLETLKQPGITPLQVTETVAAIEAMLAPAPAPTIASWL